MKCLAKKKFLLLLSDLVIAINEPLRWTTMWLDVVLDQLHHATKEMELKRGTD